MKAILQRVIKARVDIDNKTVASINKGYLILLGIKSGDTTDDMNKIINKLPYLRIFEDENGKMNLSILDIKGEALVVPNFTLLADCKKGRRPSFCNAEQPSISEPMFNEFCTELLKQGINIVEKGKFGADMQVHLINDGPITIMLDSDEL